VRLTLVDGQGWEERGEEIRLSGIRGINNEEDINSME
jgi:hypothetical protein